MGVVHGLIHVCFRSWSSRSRLCHEASLSTLCTDLARHNLAHPKPTSMQLLMVNNGLYMNGPSSFILISSQQDCPISFDPQPSVGVQVDLLFLLQSPGFRGILHSKPRSLPPATGADDPATPSASAKRSPSEPGSSTRGFCSTESKDLSWSKHCLFTLL